MPRNVDGEIIVGIDIPASTKIVESDIRKLLQNLTTLEAKINHADLTDNAKQELKQMRTLISISKEKTYICKNKETL